MVEIFGGCFREEFVFFTVYEEYRSCFEEFWKCWKYQKIGFKILPRNIWKNFWRYKFAENSLISILKLLKLKEKNFLGYFRF